MMRQIDRDYYHARLAEEATLMRSAATDVARAIHGRLAKLYAARLQEPVPPSYEPLKERRPSN
jgi:NAD(P)H-hydrate repair Nnr-like enzyme with NAD(P)H-hydrate epimerase domain